MGIRERTVGVVGSEHGAAVEHVVHVYIRGRPVPVNRSGGEASTLDSNIVDEFNGEDQPLRPSH